MNRISFAAAALLACVAASCGGASGDAGPETRAAANPPSAVVVYFEVAATRADFDRVEHELEGSGAVTSIRFTSREEALEILRRREPDLVEGITGNPLPASFHATVRTEPDGRTLASELVRFPRVDKVQTCTGRRNTTSYRCTEARG